MDRKPTPPPVPQFEQYRYTRHAERQPWQHYPHPAGHLPPSQSYGTKIILLAVIAGCLMIGAAMVWGMAYSRESTSNEVAARIAGQWGGEVRIDGPWFSELREDTAFVAPATFSCAAEVATQRLHRGIYEAEVFNATLKVSGTFLRDSLRFPQGKGVIRLRLNPESVRWAGPLTIAGRNVRWERDASGLYARVSLDGLPPSIDYSTELELKGSGGIFVRQAGLESQTEINGEAANPSFQGDRLPDRRDIWKRRFSSSWNSAAYGSEESAYGDDGYVGARFLVGVDRYQKVVRAIKYAFIIILLTFTGVFFVETTRRHPIPLFNYMLIGAALVIFYSLLLALAEHTSFGCAYLAAAVMTVGLITAYMWLMLRSRKVGLLICLMLSAIYGLCFIMLSVSQAALLVGSLLLFCALAATMYASLRMQR
ncbi:MAG: cell envelope integrity protein CreD [Muribaculaceae bacterium]|nr:cell envelope integrity protein CreD [Muribaculaceae bacterium]